MAPMGTAVKEPFRGLIGTPPLRAYRHGALNSRVGGIVVEGLIHRSVVSLILMVGSGGMGYRDLNPKP